MAGYPVVLLTEYDFERLLRAQEGARLPILYSATADGRPVPKATKRASTGASFTVEKVDSRPDEVLLLGMVADETKGKLVLSRRFKTARLVFT